MLSKTVYAIRDKKSGVWWSRNKWGTRDSTPDLYESVAKAMYQTDHPKSKLNLHNGLRAKYGGMVRSPEIVELLLTEDLT